MSDLHKQIVTKVVKKSITTAPFRIHHFNDHWHDFNDHWHVHWTYTNGEHGYVMCSSSEDKEEVLARLHLMAVE